MIRIIKVQGEDGIFLEDTYECNYCGRVYTKNVAWDNRGNHFFCSEYCIKEYDEQGG